jgi:hypothetical protein
MVQFVPINFFSWISSIFVGFFKSSSFFFVSFCISPYRPEVGEAEVIGCQYVVIRSVSVKKWAWSKSLGSAGSGTRDKLCEKVTGMPNGAASGVVGVELVRESWTG